MVTAAQKIIKNSNHLYICNVLHIKLVKLQSIWKSGSGSGQILQNLAPAGWLEKEWKWHVGWHKTCGLWN